MSIKPYTELKFFHFDYIQPGYLSYKTDRHEICLEPCLNGWDVALYDLEQNLIGDKYCTNVKTYPHIDTHEWYDLLFDAVKIANRKLQEANDKPG